jgi:dimethylhistidine N-methyltransferase
LNLVTPVNGEDTSPSTAAFRADVLRGLSAPQKELACKYFYDEAGSELFERITHLEEYYPTRTELAIMRRHARDMAALIGPRCLLVEFGSGSSQKTRLLLDHLVEPLAYVPIDVSSEHLRRSAAALAADYPSVEVLPICADFTRPVEVPARAAPAARRVIYFPGSTIGNFTLPEAQRLLRQSARWCGAGGAMLLGADLKKDPRLLHDAYNDRLGVTAAFNTNLLARINRELGADFPLHEFWHHAFYNSSEGRIEMHLVCKRAQKVRVAGREFTLAEGESIRTEYSYKYSPADLDGLARSSGLRVQGDWTDGRGYFCVLYLTVE